MAVATSGYAMFDECGIGDNVNKNGVAERDRIEYFNSLIHESIRCRHIFLCLRERERERGAEIRRERENPISYLIAFFQ